MPTVGSRAIDPRIGRPWVELALLAALVAAPWLPWAAGLALGGAALALWLRGNDVARERRAAGALFGAALILIVAGAVAGLARTRSPAPGAAVVEATFEAWLDELEVEARRGAGELAAVADDPRRLPAAFAALGELARAAPPERTYVLLAADGEAAAWAGRGLLHDLAPETLTSPGLAWRQSATSATLLAVATVGEGARAGRLVVGESRSRTGPAPLAGVGTAVGRWSLAPRASGDRPRLILEGAAPGAPVRRPDRFARLAALAVGLGLLVVASLRAAGRALLSGTVLPRRHPLAAVLALGATAPPTMAAALGARPATVLAVAGAALLAASGWWLGHSLRIGRGLLAAGALAGPLAFAAGWALAPQVPALTTTLGGGIDAFALRFALAGAVFGLIAAGGSARVAGTGEARAWATAALAALGAALADHPALALPALLLAGAVAAASVRREALASPAAVSALWLLAALVAGAGWTCGERLAMGRRAESAARALLPPGADLLERLRGRVRGGLAAAARAELPHRETPITEGGDLAFALWRASPLARFDALSALVVESPDGERSSFSFGLPLDGAGGVDRSPARWLDLTPTSWPELELGGEERVTGADGSAWVTRWWLIPRVGFGGVEAGAAASGDLASSLLRGGAARKRPYGLPAEVRWGLWGAADALLGSAWEQDTPAPAELTRGGSALVATPEGEARFALARAGPFTAAAFVPALALGDALERAGTVAAGGLLAAAVLAAAAFAAALPRSAVRNLVRGALRSYSKRLLIVYAALLLVPSAVLYLFLSRTLERRVQAEQELAARTALRSVQRVLGEYVLTMEPGFGVGTALDDPLLELLSRVAQHEVNLYWGGEIYASSKRDLFAAGLLPRRLPGEVWLALGVEGDELARRTSRAGAAEYLELYAPLEVPGQPARDAGLVLSMPLLAQQEEAVAEAGRLRRRVLLGTAALFLLLAATSTGLARRFTRPIEEIVAGTRRIAGGAAELGFRPEEAELEALAEAIDRMAGRIAQARERLVGEKRLVERIVESVTAGVVALDAAGRVLIVNRAARDLLGIEPGRSLAERLGEDAALAPVAGLLAGPSSGPTGQVAVRLEPRGELERDWTVVRVPLSEAGDAAELVVVEDVTGVVRAQRLEAWVAMARIIAHEIKNPLTPIRLSAEHLREAWLRDREHFEQVFERCTSNILRQVEELRDIASEFSIYSRVPRIERQEGDLVATVREVVDAYRAAPPPGVEILFESPPGSLILRFDARLIGRAVRNLLENAVRASAGRGRVEVRVEGGPGEVRVTVTDAGPGVAPELLPRVLEPYFSTHSSGTGLGLPIAARIAEEHGGSLVARNRAIGGFEVIVTIPVR
jgi:signal transduction histidine kinase